MKKLILSLFASTILLSACSGQSSNRDNPLLDEILSGMDSLTLEEGQKKFTEEYESFMSLLTFFEYDEGDVEPTIYTEEEEKKNNSELVSISSEILTLNDFKDNLTAKHTSRTYYSMGYLAHRISEDSTSSYTPTNKEPFTSELEIKTEMSKNHNSTATSFYYQVKGIYYKDGSFKETDIDSESGSFQLGDFKQIDSIKLVVTYQYPTQLITKTISNSNKTTSFDNGKISLQEIKKSNVKFIIDNSLYDRYIACQAKTKSGYLVRSGGMSSMAMSPDEAKKFVSSIKNKLGKIAEDAKANKFKTKEEFIQKIRKAGENLYFPKNDKRYFEVSFYGNVEEVYLYFTEDFKSKEFELTIPVKEELLKYNLINDPNTYKQVIVDENGKVLVNIEEDYSASQLNSYFYALNKNDDDDYRIYRLDPSKGLIEEANSAYRYRDQALGENLLGIEKNEKYGAIDGSGNIVIPAVYSRIYESESENIIIANTGDGYSNNINNYFLYDFDGKKIASGTGYLYDFYDGLGIAEKGKNSGYSFVDTKGKVIINLTGYERVENFSDGLALVVKNDKVGYIDKTGKLVIPLMYSDGRAFSTGVARVQNTDREYALINKNNEIILPFQDYSFISYSGRGEETTYSFDNKTYNSYGKLIEEKKEDEE